MSINSRSLLLAKDVIFGKQKFDGKQLKMNKFTFDVKQLNRINKFIKSIYQLIISTSSATTCGTLATPVETDNKIPHTSHFINIQEFNG